MTAPAFDPEDWRPEDEGVGTDPLNLEDLDDRWTQFYLDRMNAQVDRALKKAMDEEG